MEDLYFNSVQEFNDCYGAETLHPLISVVRFDKDIPITERMVHFGIYAIYLKENKGCRISYGRTPYDFDEMTVTSFEPGQVLHVEQPLYGDANVFPRWTAIVFHPDLLKRTSLGRNMSRYEFFSYASNEALHLSQCEVETFQLVLDMIRQELQHTIDKHTRELIVSHIELLLNYCLRFYDRQFITREELNHNTVIRFEQLLREYLETGLCEKLGTPSVAYFAEKCNLSPAYFGELVKQNAGVSAQEFIHVRLTNYAKMLLMNRELNITQVAYRLGFQYPQHFVRFFKNRMGQTPRQYREVI